MYFKRRHRVETHQNIELMTFALTWCANIFVGCSVSPTFFFGRSLPFLILSIILKKQIGRTLSNVIISAYMICFYERQMILFLAIVVTPLPPKISIIMARTALRWRFRSLKNFERAKKVAVVVVAAAADASNILLLLYQPQPSWYQ